MKKKKKKGKKKHIRYPVRPGALLLSPAFFPGYVYPGFPFVSLLFPIILLRSELRVIYPCPFSLSFSLSLSLARSLFRETILRIGNREGEIGFKEENSSWMKPEERGLARQARLGSVKARESLFSQKRRRTWYSLCRQYRRWPPE